MPQPVHRSVTASEIPGSRVAFDYIYASVLRRENRYYGEQGIFETVSKTGEGWTFGLEDGAIESFLAVRGFEIIAHYTPRVASRAVSTPFGKADRGKPRGIRPGLKE